MSVASVRTRRQVMGAVGGAFLALGARRALAQVELRIGSPQSEAYAEPYYANDEGLFARAGIGVAITPFTSGAPIVGAVTAGALDVGLADMIGVANAYNHNFPLAFIASGMLYTSATATTALCVAKDSSIRRALDFSGKVIAVSGLKTMAEVSAREWIRTNGGNPADVQFVEIGPAAQVPAIVRGTVAAAMVSEPYLSGAAGEIRRLSNAYDAVATQFYLNGWFARRDWLAKNGDLATKVVKVAYETAAWSNGHHAETAPILAKYTRIDVERIKSMTRAVYGTSLDSKLMQPVLDIAARYNMIERPVAAADIIAKVVA